MVTIVVPCNERPEVVEANIAANAELYRAYPVIVINKAGGEAFREALHDVPNVQVIDQDSSFWFARRFAYEFVKTPYTLNLDVDTVLPSGYVERALQLLTYPSAKEAKVGAVGLDYAEPYAQNHPAFGTSMWPTELLKKLYTWRLTADQHSAICECKYMWAQLTLTDLRVETFPVKAKHLRVAPEILKAKHHG